ncbi:elongation factor P [Qipengyuania sediminis]|uniref:elongation factor P n=1 Tax=Qipengyuania sediminis TaxID=1532023 RepID=UPI00105A5898|nr:elongation factor P [Qipengyuania sediminis]
MIRSAFAIALAASPAVAVAATDLGVLPQGRYDCWTAGSAAGPAVNGDPRHRFTVLRGSSYASASGGGTYLLAGDLVTFTRGPFKDLRLRRNRDGLWQEIARDGEPGRMKCSRMGGAA